MLSSLAGSGIQSLHLGELGTIVGTTLAGGLTEGMSGGSFLSGAISGMNIGMFNHGWITNAQGENVYMLDDVVVNGRMSSYALMCLRISSYLSGFEKTHTNINNALGYAYLGSNAKLYFENANTHTKFRGNQYVSIEKIATTRGMKALSYASDGFELVGGFVEDQGFGANTNRHIVHILLTNSCACIGSRIGQGLGTLAGAAIGGTLSFGIGSIPAATVGAVAGNILGGYFGNVIGENLYNTLY